MAEQTYTQCTYTQMVESTTGVSTNALRIGTAWIPTEFAKVGKRIRIDGKEGIWTVTAVGSTKGEKAAMADSRDYLKMRQVSDIKAPKRKLRDGMREE